jgi:mediator of RNA polymerase II transcription subunit 22
MKLISDIKQYLILNDFPSVNQVGLLSTRCQVATNPFYIDPDIFFFQAIAENSRAFLELQNKCDLRLTALRDEIAADLYDLEEEYYLSLTKYGDREKEKNDTR